jgi:serine/threonine protein kinase
MKSLGGYVLIERLDSGGNVEVYRATRPRTGQQVVITRLPGYIDRLWPPWAGPRIAQLLLHSNIVTLLDVIELPDHVAFVAEHVDGVDLRSLLSHGPISPVPALFIAAELCRGLDAAHYMLIDKRCYAFTHGWLCPRCIFLSRTGTVKLAGFAVGRLKPEADPPDLTKAPTERVVYVSPEQVHHEDAEPRTDLFLLGLVLHEMIAGEKPFTGKTGEALLGAMVAGRRRRPLRDLLVSGDRILRKDGVYRTSTTTLAHGAFLHAIDNLIDRMLSPDPEGRPPSAAALLEAIETLARHFQVSLDPIALARHIETVGALDA